MRDRYKVIFEMSCTTPTGGAAKISPGTILTAQKLFNEPLYRKLFTIELFDEPEFKKLFDALCPNDNLYVLLTLCEVNEYCEKIDT